MERQEPRVQVTGTRWPLGVAAILSLFKGLRDCSLIRFADWFSLLATLAIKGFYGVAKVLVEFCSDFLVTQELPAGGRRVLLVPVNTGLLQCDLGGLCQGLLP